VKRLAALPIQNPLSLVYSTRQQHRLEHLAQAIG
jgi:hypothetical protein